MRRLPGILLLTVATLIVIVALLVSGLRLVLPQLDAWRPQLLEKISTLTGTPVDASQITASWQTFGPTLDVRDIQVGLKDGGKMAGSADVEIRVPHFGYADRIQEIHIKVIHILIMLIEKEMVKG